jgi:FtsH-binding integral membrane protein
LESALNIVWLILSALLVVCCSLWGRPAFNSRKQRIVIAVALACLIAFLLFPVISMTDDLTSGAVAADTPNYKHWFPTAELSAVVATGLLIAFSGQSRAWADGSILAEPVLSSPEAFSFHLSRRPPPIA